MSDEDTVQLPFLVTRAQRRRFKTLAAERDTSMQALLRHAVNQMLKEAGEWPEQAEAA